MIIRHKLTSSVSVAALLSILPVAAFASGFALNEQSAVSTGLALSNMSIERDAAVQFSNPAGLAMLDGTQILGGANAYFTHAHFGNNGTTHTILGAPTTGPNASTDSMAAAPFGYISHAFDYGLTGGLGIYSPFGLATNYAGNSSMRYQADKSNLRTVEINPNLAYRINKEFSIGAGPTFRWSRGEFSNNIDYGSIATGAAILGGTPAGTAAALFRPQGTDGRIKVHGQNWAVGYKLGALWEPTPNTTVGLGYRSQMDSRLTGQAEFNSSTSGAFLTTATGSGVTTGANATIHYPDSLDLTIGQKIRDDLRLSGDFNWTHWSRFNQLAVNFNNPAQRPAVTQENWNDGYRVSLGAEYDVMPQWTLRGGVAYDTTPVPSSEFRTGRIPDSDRQWLALGAGYALTDNIAIDVGYAYLFFSDTTIHHTDTTSFGGTVNGTYNNTNAQILSADIRYKF